ncbi:MAG: aminotransferase class I/II-fold pyridoxal phosphate-dependent enzyme [Chitinophagaceae bacterium]
MQVYSEQENIQEQVDIVNGTLSKAIGVFGGYIAASQTLVDFIRSFGSGFIFTTSLPPARMCRREQKHSFDTRRCGMAESISC